MNIRNPGIHLFIRTTQRILSFYQKEREINTYPVAVGKPATPTPTGNFKVINKLINPGGVLGSRWMGLNIPGGNYGIHGTNNPSSIGKAISNGCIRMHNHDIEELFPKIFIGTPVTITSIIEAHPPRQPDQKTSTNLPIQPNTTYHEVQPGDTLWSISRRLGLPLEVILQLNKLANPNLIYPGQKIIIPEKQAV